MLQVRTVVFPTDDSPCAEAARPVAERLARRHVLRVEVVPPRRGPPVRPGPRARRRLRRRRRRRGPPPVPHGLDAVARYAAEVDADVVVMGTHGRSGWDRLTLGSTAERVLRQAPCAVLTLRAGACPLVGPDGEARTLAVPRSDRAALFDALSHRTARPPHTVTVAVVSPEAEGTVYDAARFVGVTYDDRDDAVEVMVEGGEHHVVRPFSVGSTAGAWTLDAARNAEAPGPWVLDVVRTHRARERITICPVGDPIPS